MTETLIGVIIGAGIPIIGIVINRFFDFFTEQKKYKRTLLTSRYERLLTHSEATIGYLATYEAKLTETRNTYLKIIDVSRQDPENFDHVRPLLEVLQRNVNTFNDLEQNYTMQANKLQTYFSLETMKKWTADDATFLLSTIVEMEGLHKNLNENSEMINSCIASNRMQDAEYFFRDNDAIFPKMISCFEAQIPLMDKYLNLCNEQINEVRNKIIKYS